MTTDTIPDPLDVVLEREERVTRLKHALRTMTPKERQVLLRHQSGGKPLTRVAAEMCISHSEAQRHLDSARYYLAAVGNA